MSPKAFLFKVARNLALNELARQSSAASEPLGDFEGEEVFRKIAIKPQRMMQLIVANVFVCSRARLPRCRHNAQRYSSSARCKACRKREIAARLNISVRTVENHVALGLVRCKVYMRAHGGAFDQGSGISRISEPAPGAFAKAKTAE